MNIILEELYLSLKESFETNLSSKDKKYNDSGELDVFKTYLSLSKSQKDFRKLIELGSIPKDVLIYRHTKEKIDSGLKDNLFRRGSLINDNKIFIASRGLFEYYKNYELNLGDVFTSFDDFKFAQETIKLKVQEKILSILLILFGAESEESKLDTTKLDPRSLDKYFNFLKLIESRLTESGINLGKKVGWGKGKDVNFRSFIGNNVDLPSTGLYHCRPTSTYWLDLGKRKNVNFLLDLILDNYKGEDRVLVNGLFYSALRSLSNDMLTELAILPKDLNSFIVENLRG